MAITFVQQASNSNSTAATTMTVTLAQAPIAGNFLVAFYGNGSTTTTVSSIASTSATWTKYDNSATNADVEIWYALNLGASPGTSVVVTMSTSTLVAGIVAEFSGVATSAATDGAVTKGTYSGTTATTGNKTTANANDLLVAGFTDTGPAVYNTPTNSFIKLTQPSAQNTATIGASYRIVSSTGTYSTGFTESVGDGTGDTIIGAFKASGVTASTGPEFLRPKWADVIPDQVRYIFYNEDLAWA